MRPVSKILSVISVVCLLPFSANALVFTDEAAFQTAAGGVVLEDFEGYSLLDPVTALPALGLTVSPLSNGSAARGYDQSLGGFTRSGTISLMNNDKLGLPGLGPLEFVADPGTSFNAIGYWNGGADDTSRLTLYDADNNVIETAVVVDTNGGSLNPATFLGIITTAHAVRAVISPEAGNGWFAIDDLQVGSVSVQIHAPGALPLLFGALYWFRRRR